MLELNGALILLKFLVYTILYFKLTKQKESSGVYWLLKLIHKHLELTLYWIIGKHLVQFRILLTNKNRCNILRNRALLVKSIKLAPNVFVCLFVLEKNLNRGGYCWGVYTQCPAFRTVKSSCFRLPRPAFSFPLFTWEGLSFLTVLKSVWLPTLPAYSVVGYLRTHYWNFVRSNWNALPPPYWPDNL